MLSEIWVADLTVLFIEASMTEPSESLGFHHLHPRDRFWELLVVGGITPGQIITSSERKALAEGHKAGSLSDPVRMMFTQKKKDQLLRLGIGLTTLNRRTVAADLKDGTARPVPTDVEDFTARVHTLRPGIVAFVTAADVFVEAFGDRYPGVTATLGPKSFRIGDAEVWLLGATTAVLRGTGLSNQEDAFYALGERIQALKGKGLGGP